MLFRSEEVAQDAAAGGAEEPVEQSVYGPQNLLDPTNPLINEIGPDEYRARFETSKGDFVIEVHRDWAPLGADRFYNLVKSGFYDDVAFFRVYEDDRPVSSAQHFKFSKEGAKNGELVFISGNPGRTERFATTARLLEIGRAHV